MKKNLLFLLLLMTVMFNYSQISLVKNISPNGDGVIGNIIAVNNSVIFSGDNQTYSTPDFELYISDGTNTGTQLLQNIGPGDVSGSPKDFFHWVNPYTNSEEVFFAINNQSSGGNFDFWITNGTTSGTSLVYDHNTSGSSNPKNYIEFDSNGLTLLALQARGTNVGEELYISVGASGGNTLIEDINPGIAGSFPDNFVLYNNKLYFAATSSNGRELWESNGALNSTFLVKNISPGNADGNPENMIVYNNKIYFSADNGTNGTELWQSDGTTAGTQMVFDISPGSAGSNPENFIIYNSNLYFTATNSIFGTELFYIDTNGTVSLANDISSGSASSNPSNFYIFNNTLYFSADNGINGNELWRTNGTIATTQMVNDINLAGSSNPNGFIDYNNELYFVANDGTHGNEIWKTDGTSSGSQILGDINPSGDSDPFSLVTTNNVLFFTANDGTNGRELWKYIDPSLSNEDINQNNTFKLYPNPTTNSFSIDSDTLIQSIELSDISGKQVKLFTESQNNYDISELVTGIYFAKIHSNIGIETFKIIKK